MMTNRSSNCVAQFPESVNELGSDVWYLLLWIVLVLCNLSINATLLRNKWSKKAVSTAMSKPILPLIEDQCSVNKVQPDSNHGSKQETC